MLDQLVVGAAPGDAITRCALLVREALSVLGPSEIYAQHREPGVFDVVRPIDELHRRPNAARPLVFHASIGSWVVLDAIESREPSLVLVYHNFSPPEFFAPFAPDVADDLIRGRWELARLRPRVRGGVAVSGYNAGELRDLGYERVAVAAPAPDIDRLARIAPDVPMVQRITTWGPGPLLLCVAQQLPHKRLERVIAAAAVLQQEYLPDARLAVVGVERFPRYSRGLRALARSVGLRDLHLLGRVTDAELAALYMRAAVFLTLSEHEGFCVPAVEAMALGVPVVASARAAIPDTLGDAGVLVDDPDDPVLVAGVLAEVLGDPDMRHLMIGRGMSRARRLAASHSLPELVDAVLEFAVGTPEGSAPDGVPDPVAAPGAAR